MRNSFPCPQWSEKLTIRQEDLTPTEYEELKGHLSYCPACQAALDEYNLILSQLRSLPVSFIDQLLSEDITQETKKPTLLPIRSRQQIKHGMPLQNMRAAFRPSTKLAVGILAIVILLSQFIALIPPYSHIFLGKPLIGNTFKPRIAKSSIVKIPKTTPEEDIRQIIQKMTLEEKLGQLLLVQYVGNNYQNSDLQYMITQQHIGGFIYLESNGNFQAPYDTTNNVKAFSQRAMTDAHIPLLIAVDQEGGLVNRLKMFYGNLPSAQAMSQSGNQQTVQKQGSQTAQWMEKLGINVDLAPVVDVGTPDFLRTRTFGQDPNTVTSYAGAFLNGLQSTGIAGCLKHFPGLGAASSDPHEGLPVVTRNKTDLENIDLAPYRSLIRKDSPEMIMSTNAIVEAFDKRLPAEFSPKIITNLLRGKLGYRGVVISDNLHMNSISAQWPLGEAAVLSIIAGNDIILGPSSKVQVTEIVTALKQAIQQNKLTIKQVDESLQRILMMKYHMHLLILPKYR